MTADPPILGRLRGVERRAGKEWAAFCPAHDDARRSLSVGIGVDGKTLLHCHAGCTAETITGKVNMTLGDLAPHPDGRDARHAQRREVCTYDYTDAAGELLFQVVRFEPKDFRCRRPDGHGGWLWNIEGVRLVPYRLPDLAEAPGVFVVEGEKDCDALAALGLVATCNHGGAGKWRNEHTTALVSAAVPEVVVLPDNDSAGEGHAQNIATACTAAGIAVKIVRLPDLPAKGDVSDYIAAARTAGRTDDEIRTALTALADAATLATTAAPMVTTADAETAPGAYIETAAAFLAADDVAVEYIFPELLPAGVVMLVHGEPRARKSLAAFELTLAAAAGAAPFGLSRYAPPKPVPVLYVQEEDPRALTRQRMRALCRNAAPANLHVAVRRGIDLDDPVWVARLTADVQRLGIRLLVLDAARRLSAKTDEGPAKVRELMAVLRALVTTTGVTIIIVHHDTKPPANGQDQRRRSQRASGGDWFAASECPVHVERVGALESLVYPQDYKFAADPQPFTFTCETDGAFITALVGTDVSPENAEHAGMRGKVLDWLRLNGPASTTKMQKARLGQWDAIVAARDALLKEGKIDAGPGRQKGAYVYFVNGALSVSEKGSTP